MPIAFTCPHCGTPMNVADQYAGQTGPCGKCGGTITIPGGRNAALGAAPAAPAASYGQSPVYGQPSGYGQAPAYGQPAGYGAAPGSYPGTPTASRSSSSFPILLVVLGGGALFLVFGFGLLMALLLPAVQSARQAARRVASANNMKMIGLAMHNYHDTFMTLPYAGSPDPKQGLGMSWRARMLPYLEDVSLYNQVEWKEPWDSPTNHMLVERMPRTYQSQAVPGSTSNTIYLAVVDSEIVPLGGAPRDPIRFRPVFTQDGRKSPFSNIIDGTSNTVIVVEADPELAAIWTKPQDLVFDPQMPRQGLGKTQGKGFQVLMADGSIRFIDATIDDNAVRSLMLQNDGR